MRRAVMGLLAREVSCSDRTGCLSREHICKRAQGTRMPKTSGSEVE